jgi:hypothetical protein
LRFISDGIRDTMDHYRRDQLPLYRLAWELHRRIDTLVPHAPSVWIDQLRDLQRRVAEVQAGNHRAGLTALEHAQVNDSLRQLQTMLDNSREWQWLQ